jgi:hypothetical protein
MRLDDFMPQWHFDEYHQTMIAAPPEVVYESIRNLDASCSPVVGLLLRLRELPLRLKKRDFKSPGLGPTLDNMIKMGFIALADEAPRELVIGLAGLFWTLDLEILDLEPREFPGFAQAGYAKVAANFLVTRLGPGTSRLSTETRVQCLDPKSKRGFRRYWFMIRPFSGLIRLEWLRIVKREAEHRARRQDLGMGG